MAGSAEFDTTVVATGNNTGIVVPEGLIKELGAGGRPSVLVDLNGYQYSYTVGVMGGSNMIGVSAAIRKATGLKGGDPVHVSLTLAEGPREVVVPEDFAGALEADPVAKAFFSSLANSLQRYHVDAINGAKTGATRERRIQKALELFRAGKKR